MALFLVGLKFLQILTKTGKVSKTQLEKQLQQIFLILEICYCSFCNEFDTHQRYGGRVCYFDSLTAHAADFKPNYILPQARFMHT